MNETNLSVTVITLNEEENLSKCLDSIKSIAGEIIVVDSGSTDKTVEIAKKFGAKIFAREFDNYGAQKNFAVKKATKDWIFSIDADEVVTRKLAKEIKEVIKSNEFEGYTIPRKNFILGKFIRHSRWSPELDRHIWLWKKGRGMWVGEVHEEVEVKGRVGRLKSHKIHHHYQRVRDFFEMMDSYSELESEKIIKKGKRFFYLKLFYDPIYEFLVRFLYRLGFLDGKEGLILSILSSYGSSVKYFKIWEIQSNNNH